MPIAESQGRCNAFVLEMVCDLNGCGRDGVGERRDISRALTAESDIPKKCASKLVRV